MTNINEIVACVKWINDKEGNRPDFETPAGCSWQDMTGQPAESLPCTPNVYLIRAFVTDAVYAVVNADVRFVVLARRVYDVATPDVWTTNTFGDKPTSTQLTTLKNLIIARFPGVDADKLADAGKSITSGMTREDVIGLLAARWVKFIKAVS